MAKSTNIYGVHAVLEALKAGKRLDKIMIRRDLEGDMRKEIAAAAKEAGIPMQQVPREKLDRLAKGGNHQGVIALGALISYVELEDMLLSFQDQGKSPMIMLLDGVTDVRNLGAIARSAECMGVDLLVLPLQGTARINSDAIKISAGALNHLAVARVGHAVDAVNMLHAYEIQTIACSEKANDTIFDVDFAKPICIIMGDEEKGIQARILKTASTLAKIPMEGKVSSLNVSVAAGMILLEATRQRNS